MVPFVEDRRNTLVLDWADRLPAEGLASLQWALKRGIQATFDLEDSELAAEALPSRAERRRILLYESSEGGAGVLRQLVAAEHYDLGAVARAALDILHFTADGTDLGAAEPGSERCEKACYDCLLSYTNQPDHLLLDRHAVRAVLLDLADGTTTTDQAAPAAGPSVVGDVDHPFLAMLRERGYRQPTAVGVLVEPARARPDFVYPLPDGQLGVFVELDEQPDGLSDEDAQERLSAQPHWHALRLRRGEDWPTVLARMPSVFLDVR